MDEEEKEKLVILNKINNILEERVLILNKVIEDQNQLIEQDKNQLQLITEEIVKNEEELSIIKEEKEKNTSDLESIESEMKDLQSEIDKGLAEIEILASQMNSQKPKDDALSIIYSILNPIGSIIEDIVFLCTNSIKELEGKMNNLANELGKKGTNYSEFEQKKNQIEMKLNDANCKNIYLNEQRGNLEIKLKELGIQKTKNEDFKLNLQLLKSKCLILIDETNQGKELLDADINMVLEIQDNLKLLYSKNGLILLI
ncbi:hypothetical protein DDB_G0270092 [Dictyostelium discoideum AX4]|uniref:Uncharacterized protein n=1 Tax=Dictyostelium discoideum TaxID=44689 RepID=Q55CE7_DICDI|nr:hypothetical protein DDB_G0270092 [Dictyostelium discoideum AX4]EAL72396.1 hypothetical protein DDB_G0270092 [Dictyostelium discoideum AX4]|eukprot:XP_646534.1 hypothetical protein DDB_G0270092 [Dictyostelium discoideum AX4]